MARRPVSSIKAPEDVVHHLTRVPGSPAVLVEQNARLALVVAQQLRHLQRLSHQLSFMRSRQVPFWRSMLSLRCELHSLHRNLDALFWMHCSQLRVKLELHLLAMRTWSVRNRRHLLSVQCKLLDLRYHCNLVHNMQRWTLRFEWKCYLRYLWQWIFRQRHQVLRLQC